jgi:hypothetical protein
MSVHRGNTGGGGGGLNNHKLSIQIQIERLKRIETAKRNMKGTAEYLRSVAKRMGGGTVSVGYGADNE